MALFTDGPLSTIEVLVAYDSTVLETARNEGIDLATKLALAQEELGIELRRFFARRGVWELELGNVVASEALRKCHAFRALALAFREASHTQLNERYRARWEEWEKAAAWAWEALLETGVGIVEKPIPRPRRLVVTKRALPAAAGTYYVKAAWVNGAGEEGSASEAAVVTTADGEGLVVQLPDPPDGVTGWNVYVGYGENETMKQNQEPIPPGQSWAQEADGLREGPGPSEGQRPSYYVRISPGPSEGSVLADALPGLLLRG